MLKRTYRKFLYKPKLHRIIEVDRKGNDLGTICYLYEPSMNLFSVSDLLDPNESKRMRLYCIIQKFSSYQKMNDSYFITHSPDFKHNYYLPKGISKNSDIYSDRHERSKASEYLKELAYTVLDSLCVEMIEAINLDLKINAELIIANSTEKDLLITKRQELFTNLYQPFEMVLGNLFDRLEKEHLLQRNIEIVDPEPEPEVSMEIQSIVNSKINNFSDRHERAINLLQSFKDLD